MVVMTSLTTPGPLGLSPDDLLIDTGTLCRATSPLPGPQGFVPTAVALPAASKAVQVERRASRVDVDAYLQALAKPKAPPLVRQRAERAAAFFETRFLGKSFAQIMDYLRGIDFSKDVRVVKLAAVAPYQSDLIQYVAGNRPGNFFAKPGVAHDRLGIALGTRQFRRFRVTNIGVDVLVCTATQISDTWTHGRTLDVYSPIPGHQPWQPPTRAGQFARGGGLQIIIPDPVQNYVTPLDDPS